MKNEMIILNQKPNGSDPLRAVCTCGHIGGCPNSDHTDSKLELGHGACKVKGCKCQKFTWKAFAAHKHMFQSTGGPCIVCGKTWGQLKDLGLL